MGELKEVIGPLIATHPEAAWLFGLIEAFEDGSLDARFERISALLVPAKPPSGPVEAFL
jgi:hypothetical protein